MGFFPKWLGVFLKCVRFQSAWIRAGEVEICSLLLPEVSWYQGLLPAFANFQWCVKERWFAQVLKKRGKRSFASFKNWRQHPLLLGFFFCVPRSLLTYILHGVGFFNSFWCAHLFKDGVRFTLAVTCSVCRKVWHKELWEAQLSMAVATIGN